jgi:hypothetical protein
VDLTGAALAILRGIGLPAVAGAVTGIGTPPIVLIIYELITIPRIRRSTMWAPPLFFRSLPPDPLVWHPRGMHSQLF